MRTIADFVVEHATDALVYAQVYEAKQYLPAFQLGYDYRLIVDAGANVGISTVWFHEMCPRADVIAVEPYSRNNALLSKNVSRNVKHTTASCSGEDGCRTLTWANIENGFMLPGRIENVQAALWSHRAIGELHDPGKGPWSIQVRPVHAIAYQRRESQVDRDIVPMLTMAELGLGQRPAMLKMDIEGAEAAVFKDSANWMHHFDVIACELHGPEADAAFAEALRTQPRRYRRWFDGTETHFVEFLGPATGI